MWREGDSLWVKVGVPADIIKYIVPKGFVAIDGTSLTICEVNNTDKDGGPWFTFMLIAHTQECIIVPQKKIGMYIRTYVALPLFTFARGRLVTGHVALGLFFGRRLCVLQ
jgi:riboflavin synthase alpha subunit